MNLKDVVVKESPYKRHINSLLKRYRSKLLVDLHNCTREYRPSVDRAVDGRDLIALIGSPKHIDDRIAEFVRENNYSVGTVDIQHRNPRYIVAELYPWIPKKVSVDFLATLLKFLKS